MLEDKLLLRRFKSGSSDAFRRIYEKYANYLLTVAGALLGDANAAEDIVHDVFCSLIQSRDKIRLSGNLKSYLRTCAANLARDKMRSAQGRNVGLGETDPPAAGTDPGRLAIFDEESRKLVDALTSLPYEQREVLILHIRGGMKFRQVAAMLGVSINTAKSRYRYGLQKLRSILK